MDLNLEYLKNDFIALWDSHAKTEGGSRGNYTFGLLCAVLWGYVDSLGKLPQSYHAHIPLISFSLEGLKTNFESAKFWGKDLAITGVKSEPYAVASKNRDGHLVEKDGLLKIHPAVLFSDLLEALEH